MERKLVTIQKVESVVRHPGADALELVKVLGWRSVARMGLLKAGDLVVWHEIDSFLPPDHPTFPELQKNAIVWHEKRGVRIRTIKLRDELSQGLARPLSEFPKLLTAGIDLTPGVLDLAGYIGVEKWEKDIPEGSNAKAGFPSFMRKTDQERLQNIWDKFGNAGETQPYCMLGIDPAREPDDSPAPIIQKSEVPYPFIRNTPYEVTLKLDGTSMSVFWRDGEYGVCGKENEWQEEEDSPYWKVAARLQLKERLNQLGQNIALQGELYGPGIEGNHDKLKELEFYVYDIFDIQNYRKFSRDERLEILSYLNRSVAGVPEIKSVPLIEIREFDFQTIEEALSYADGDSITPGVKREGVVWKSIENPDMSFKIISNPYLLKHGD